MIKLWITEGRLVDPHNEFFVAEDPNIAPERLWYDKYSLRTELIPSFMSDELAKKASCLKSSAQLLDSGYW